MADKQKRTMMRSRYMIIALGITLVVGIAIVALVFAILAPLIQPLVDAGDAFFTAIQNEDLDAAYAMLAPELQAQVSVDEFNETFTAYGLESWSYQQRINRNGEGRLEGNMTIQGEVYHFTLNLLPTADSWQITNYRITNQR